MLAVPGQGGKQSVIFGSSALAEMSGASQPTVVGLTVPLSWSPPVPFVFLLAPLGLPCLNVTINCRFRYSSVTAFCHQQIKVANPA